MISRLRTPRRPLVALLLLSAVACARPHSAAEGSAPAAAPAPRPDAAAAAGPARPAPDPIAPIASGEYVSSFAARRQVLLDRGLRLGAGDVGYYMDVQEARLRQLGGPALRLTRRDLSLVLELPGQLTFEIGSARLSQAARNALSGVARVLVDYRFSIITVDGHTDDSGIASANRLLSEQRASAVAKELVAGGVEADRIVVVGRGSDRPIADNATEVGREANRRVVMRIDPLQR